VSNTSNNQEPLSIHKNLKIDKCPVFIRKVGRPRNWKEPLSERDVLAARQVFASDGGPVSLWRINSNMELRRVTIAINESRQVFHEKLDLLPILPDEIASLGVMPLQTPGRSECPPAAGLHYDVTMNDTEAANLCRILIEAGRELGRCTPGQMKLAVEVSESEGCFAVSPESVSCDCGASRT